ncbi:NepR family anti-sigma factor [Hephaestia sp. GCM10023244]|uniref:NepR family anti-sigma factor n=1 Tax=Hephaestia sp. MAHUQ-44 TaxID=2952526 RepID=UPI00207737C2|nr:NepR family anti-sigma factor [Hephaestia sp. MAHUQ-44]MCM8730692.1 hypothetical protein [Hephaestia sp. MAHUQ-44]
MGSDRSAPKGKPGKPGLRAKVQTKKQDMGAALRSVYRRTVEEDVPSEMLDLLHKLG